MYGFQPKHLRDKPVQKLADGGMVHSIKGMLGLRPRTPDELRAADAKAQARNQEAAAAAAERAKAAPAPSPAPSGGAATAVSGYAGMTAAERREKAAGFKSGGVIRGPGTGTSDSIETEKRPGTFIMPADSTQAIGPDVLEDMGEKVPVRLSDGEFEFPPDQVQALGEAVLTVMRDATHKPVGGNAKEAHGFVPHQSFADGGSVKDEEKRRLANQTSMYVQGAQAAAASRPAAPPEAPAPAAPAPAPAQPTAAPVAAGFMPGTRAVFNESGKAIGDLVSQGRYGAAAGETARAALAYGPALVDDVVGGAFRAAAPAVEDAGKQFFGLGNSGAQAPQDPLAAAPAAPPAPAPQAAQAPAPAAPDATAQPSVATPPSAAAPAPGAVTRNGNSYSGTNVTGDVSINGAAPRGGGQISAKNMAAADALAGRQSQESAARVQQAPAGFAPAGLTAPVVRNSTKDWAARKALENAATSASSITNNGGKFDRSGPGDSVAMAGYKAALATDQALQQAQPGLEQTALRENGANQRAALQDAGATTRTVIQDQGSTAREAGRTALGRGELELRRTAAGFQTRAAAQMESLQNAYANEKDQAKQAVLARQIREIQGKEQPARYKVAAGGQQIDANGVAYKVPDRVFNEQTGQFADAAATAAPTKARPVGTTSTVNGKTAVWDGEKWVPRG